MNTGKTPALTRWTFVGKVMSLIFNMLFRLVIAFLPRSKSLLISWLQSPSAVILEPQTIKSATVATVSPSICHEVMGPDSMILVFWMLSFKPTFSLSSFHFHQEALYYFSTFCHKGSVICYSTYYSSSLSFPSEHSLCIFTFPWLFVTTLTDNDLLLLELRPSVVISAHQVYSRNSFQQHSLMGWQIW